MKAAATSIDPSPLPGLVVARHRSDFLVEDGAGRRHRCLAARRDVRPLVGDRVEFLPGSDGDSGRILAVGARDNCLARIDSRGRSEPLAANLTQLLVVIAPEPDPDLSLVDRFLCAARLIGVAASLVCNKHDLIDRHPTLAPLLQTYQGIGYPLLTCSAKKGEGLEALQAMLKNQVSSLVGQSGVGKSSLVNRLVPDAAQAVGEISGKSREGRHTTTTAVACRLPQGGLVIDFPGVRGYSPPLPEAVQLQSGFIEIAALAGDCRFGNCLHQEEPGCAVKAAVAAQRIDARRYASYLNLLQLAARLETPHSRRRGTPRG